MKKPFAFLTVLAMSVWYFHASGSYNGIDEEQCYQATRDVGIDCFWSVHRMKEGDQILIHTCPWTDMGTFVVNFRKKGKWDSKRAGWDLHSSWAWELTGMAGFDYQSLSETLKDPSFFVHLPIGTW